MMILLIILGGLSYRIRGGALDEFVRIKLDKPSGWQIPNFILRMQWAIFVSCLFPLNLLTPVLMLLLFIGTIPGYFDAEFDLCKKENRIWKNYILLAARGTFIILPSYFCLFQFYPPLFGGVLAGMLMPVYYLIGAELVKNKLFSANNYSQISEFLIGASISGGILWLR